MQSAVWAAIAVRAAIGDPARIESVQVATTHIGHFILANDAEKWRPTTRETADHSLPYTVARALLDGALTVRSYAPAAITAPEVRALMDKVTVVEDPELTAMTPTFLPNRVTVRTRDGAEFSEQVADAAGGARKAMTDQQFEDKFRTLLEDLASEEQATRILDLVRSLDEAAHVDELLAAAVLERAARHQRADDGRGVTSPVLDPQVAALLSPVAERSPRPPGPPVREVRDLGLPLRGRTLPARLYGGDLDDCLVVFFHGGGFVTGDLDSHDAQARDLCRTTGRPVLSVAYRLAPDHPFPAAYDDAVAAVSWAGAHLAGRVAVAGPSAGANLALGAALALAGSPAAPVAQLLAYPLVSGDPSYPSRTEMGEGCGLTSEAIEWCLGRYLTDPAQRHDPRAAPLLSPDLASAPPAVVVGAGLDPLRDEARALAERLRIAEVRVRYVEEPTLPHGFWKFAPLADAARAAAGRMGGAFRVLLDAAGRTHRAGGSGTSCTDP
jgi:acetyl esterase